jgi:hypothetical protein
VLLFAAAEEDLPRPISDPTCRIAVAAAAAAAKAGAVKAAFGATQPDAAAAPAAAVCDVARSP